jgi:hypothetical protein
MADEEEWEVRLRPWALRLGDVGGVAGTDDGVVSQENLEAIETLEASGVELDEISWEEVMKHNTLGDMWVSIVSPRYPFCLCVPRTHALCR